MLLTLCVAFVGSGPLSVRLPDGNTVYLSYVSDAPRKRAWRPDGSPAACYLSSDPMDSFQTSSEALHGELEVFFTLKLIHKPVDIRNPDGSTYGWQPTFSQVDPKYLDRHELILNAVRTGANTFVCRRVLIKPSDGKPFSLTLRLSDSQWKTVAQTRFSRETKISGDSFISAPVRVPGLSEKATNDSGRAFQVSVPTRWKDYDYRLMAFDWTGHCQPSGGMMHTAAGKNYAWFTCQNKNVSRVELQVRPFKTVQFKAIQAQPKT